MTCASSHNTGARRKPRPAQRPGVPCHGAALPHPGPAPCGRRHDRRAFTLAELLVVITVIAILLGLLYGAIRTVSRFSRETITRGELANIEAAWTQYYAYYHNWPTNDVVVDATPPPLVSSFQRFDNTGGDVQYEIGRTLANILAGIAFSNNAEVFNPDGVAFLEMTRFDSGGAPISAWGNLRGQRYYVKLDVNGDNAVSVPLDNNFSQTTNLYRRVAVWTVHPDKPTTLIGSWQ
jgi:prepilin-type N-terminal cleavage/methylation domain-containing protein